MKQQIVNYCSYAIFLLLCTFYRAESDEFAEETRSINELSDAEKRSAVVEWLQYYDITEDEIPQGLSDTLFPLMLRALSGEEGHITEEDTVKIQELYGNPENFAVIQELYNALGTPPINTEAVDHFVKDAVKKLPHPVTLDILSLEELLKFAIYSWSHPNVIAAFEEFTRDSKIALNEVNGMSPEEDVNFDDNVETVKTEL